MSTESIQLEIIDVGYGGRGVARHDGFVVFVPGTLTGEKVRATVVRKHKKFGEARLEEIISPSPSRIEPTCPLAGICPGCAYQHVSYEAEGQLKQSQFISLLGRIGGMDVSPNDPELSPVDLGYRNKIVLHAAPKGETPALGYVGENNRTIIDVESCPLAKNEINECLISLRADEEFRSELAPGSRLTIRQTAADGVWHWTDHTTGASRWFTEQTTLGDMYVPPDGFFQVNKWGCDTLMKRVQAITEELKPENVVDLYCGCGCLTLAVAGNTKGRVKGIDRDRKAIDAATANAKARAMNNMTFISGMAATKLESVRDMITGAGSMVICDPPRAGLDKELLKHLLDARPESIIYVSCAADTLARDIRKLAEREYKVISTHLIDMFPRTAHFESLTLLQRGY